MPSQTPPACSTTAPTRGLSDALKIAQESAERVAVNSNRCRVSAELLNRRNRIEHGALPNAEMLLHRGVAREDGAGALEVAQQIDGVSLSREMPRDATHFGTIEERAAGAMQHEDHRTLLRRHLLEHFCAHATALGCERDCRPADGWFRCKCVTQS